MQFRRLTKADLEDVMHLEKMAFEDGALSLKDLRTTCASTTTEAFVALIADVTMGYVIGKRDGFTVEIVRMAVLPNARRMGIGRNMIGRYAKALGSDITLESRARGAWGEFLKACKFKPAISYPGGQILYRRGWRFTRPPELSHRGVR